MPLLIKEEEKEEEAVDLLDRPLSPEAASAIVEGFAAGRAHMQVLMMRMIAWMAGALCRRGASGASVKQAFGMQQAAAAAEQIRHQKMWRCSCSLRTT